MRPEPHPGMASLPRWAQNTIVTLRRENAELHEQIWTLRQENDELGRMIEQDLTGEADTQPDPTFAIGDRVVVLEGAHFWLYGVRHPSYISPGEVGEVASPLDYDGDYLVHFARGVTTHLSRSSLAPAPEQPARVKVGVDHP